MKKIFFKWQPYLILVAMCIGLASCGDDDEKVKPNRHKYVDEIVDIGEIRYKTTTDGSARVIGSLEDEDDGVSFYRMQGAFDRRYSPVDYPDGEKRSDYKGSLVIPRVISYGGAIYSVTSIGGFAFYKCSGLKFITIPESVTSIGEWAFFACSGLTTITIPCSVTSIDEGAFFGCSGLKSIIIPESVAIGKAAFFNCSGFTSISIPDGLTTIGQWAFYGCTGLPVIDNVRYADTYLVVVTDKTQSTYTIKEGTRFIGSSAFSGCSRLTSITIPNSVMSIGDEAFMHCFSLTSITIPYSVMSIGDDAFMGCSRLTSVTIGSGVTRIGSYAFDGCSGLTSIYVDSNNSVYDSRNNCNAIIETSSNTLILGCKNTVIPNSVTSIGGGAFEGCSGLTSITIPESVTSIGSSAFSDCSRLTSVICLAEDVPTGSNVFRNVPQSTATLYVPEASVDAYKSANQWKEFGNIVGIDPTAVEELKSNKILK